MSKVKNHIYLKTYVIVKQPDVFTLGGERITTVSLSHPVAAGYAFQYTEA